MVQIRSLDEREFTDGVVKKDIKTKLKKLTDESMLPEYFGELFLFEIRASENKCDDFLKQRVILLRLQ